MTGFDIIQDIAAENFGLVSTQEARCHGVSVKALNALVRRGRLEHRGYGVYRLVRQTPSEADRYAEAISLVGRDAILYGESVLALNNLALVEPGVVFVQPLRRCRKRLPPWIHLVRPSRGKPVCAIYGGIPCQPVACAIRACIDRVMPDRLSTAVLEARRNGFLTTREASSIRKEILS